MSKISVRLLFDREKKRVVFAEAGSDFIDVLFSFLTLPLGRIVRLLSKQTGLGSLDNIYESVEQLDTEDLQTEACKEMLLNPRSAAARLCEDLKIKNIHDANPRDFYHCKESDCMVQSKCYFTYVTKGRCGRCGKQMDYSWEWSKVATEKLGVFVNDKQKFIITDDLQVMPTSLTSVFSLLEELQITDASILEEKVVDICTEEALNLLRRSLVSKRALTEFYFPDACVKPSVKSFLVVKKEIDGGEAEPIMKVKIILNKQNNKVLYAEVGGDFMNQLLSFLTFPLGSVFRLLNDRLSLMGGCISNLYSSAESLGLEWFKSDICKNMIISLKLPSCYGCKNQMLKLDEMASSNWTCSKSCIKCYRDNGCKSCINSPCKHGLSEAKLIEQNPKLEKGGSDSGGGFVKDSERFLVTDDLHISLISVISFVKGMKIKISDLVDKEVNIGAAEVTSLLSAMLISKTVLNDVFSPKKKQQRKG